MCLRVSCKCSCADFRSTLETAILTVAFRVFDVCAPNFICSIKHACEGIVLPSHACLMEHMNMWGHFAHTYKQNRRASVTCYFQEEWQRATAGAKVPPHHPADLDQLRLHRPQRDLKLFVFANCWHHRFTVLLHSRCVCVRGIGVRFDNEEEFMYTCTRKLLVSVSSLSLSLSIYLSLLY
jgi:hypothetical protein